MRNQVDYREAYHETISRLQGDGILLLAGDPPNPMTIGWGTIGPIWNKPVFTVLVRPVRHTFSLMEQSNEFTVCVLPDEYRKELAFCGTRSGRSTDKILECGFGIERCTHIPAFFITQSVIHYECRLIHRHRIDPASLDPAINSRFYPQNDWHMVYYGEILATYRNE